MTPNFCPRDSITLNIVFCAGCARCQASIIGCDITRPCSFRGSSTEKCIGGVGSLQCGLLKSAVLIQPLKRIQNGIAIIIDTGCVYGAREVVLSSCSRVRRNADSGTSRSRVFDGNGVGCHCRTIIDSIIIGSVPCIPSNSVYQPPKRLHSSGTLSNIDLEFSLHD